MSRRGRRCRCTRRRRRSPQHYGFVIDVLAAYRPTGKGRVERQVAIVRDHVLAGRSFGSAGRVGRRVRRVGADPPRPGPSHPRRADRRPRRGRSCGAAAAAGAALPGLRAPSAPGRAGLPDQLRRLALLGPGPRRPTASSARAGQRVELRVSADTVTVHRLADRRRPDRARRPPPRRPPRQSVVDPAHWDGLPDGHTRAVTLDPPAATRAGRRAVPRRIRWPRCCPAGRWLPLRSRTGRCWPTTPPQA